MSVNPVAQQIAESLGETDARPVWQIEQIVSVMGETASLGVLAQTERVESSGGMLVPDGSRRRTPGGVFFALARKELPASERHRIFGPPASPTPTDVERPTSVTEGSTRLVLLPRRPQEPPPEAPPTESTSPQPTNGKPVRAKAENIEKTPAPSSHTMHSPPPAEQPPSLDADAIVARVERDLDARLAPILTRAVQTLAHDLEALFRLGAIEAAERRLGFAKPSAPVRPKQVAAARRPHVRVDRPTDAVTLGADDLLALVRSRPGLRVDEIATALGRSIAEVQNAAAGLLAAGRLIKEGRTRGTRYSVPNGDASAGEGSTPAISDA